MTSLYFFCFLLYCHFTLILSAGHGSGYQYNCPRSFSCGVRGTLRYPFTKVEQPDCGSILINGCDGSYYSPKFIKLDKNAKSIELTSVIDSQHTITISDQDFYKRLQNNVCDALNHNYTLPPPSTFVSFYIDYNVTLFRCNHNHNINPPANYFQHKCPNYDIYYYSKPYPNVTKEKEHSFFSSCLLLQFPSKDLTDTKNILSFVSGQMVIKIVLSRDCDECCNHRGGQCRLDANNMFYCDNEPKKKRKYFKLLLGLGIGLSITLFALGVLIIRCCSRRKHAPSDLQNQSRSTYTDAIDSYHNQGPENGTVYFKIPLFSYKELEEATNNFHHANQLGSGGFGIVYYGKLRDGREVAIKRPYEHNCRRVEQFTNEIEILARTRHTNLVSLYGCTSYHSDELLLVYEHVPNHTVACHLHGDLARSGILPWHIRMKIAIETASSLAYLHASGIIHRDVKTKNILLTNNFSVKVADFGLSRLFPLDITHASTAPQGTPGYVDPEYHQCYQLTSKSDVYSFGVVLIELISSKLAVDMNRHKDEINLSNLALKKIQKGALTELVDPYLGFDSDNEVKRMIVSVAELAFQCLQRENELRPSMDEVLKVLMRIESGKDVPEHIVEEERPPSPLSPDGDEIEIEIGLFQKMMPQPSPTAVVDKWNSQSTSWNTSGH
ncbi:LEAF RUST 10 DISEASE-RESISTANCE LOCUS RECEPTOR-LIKE PROTEIN KINASE-like 1.1 [Trifolium pratense]|uniref:LEAF RUST 10 DISEASE-RESISTANCE LOCUS RECEPTOR-LIKE PROTEIN KINASE-like 1.1 n=1 Tax=Trifolium pratense TaxID=57577 RepID=UPI001E697993|nr:LEAF RUST 10 DISEASE-RESISTANCE LOCUS RECEPTOR-LIKE PROTEIN KINASE-like 1.1 [Trifolium pratense]